MSKWVKKISIRIVIAGMMYAFGYWYFDTQILNRFEEKDTRPPRYFDSSASPSPLRSKDESEKINVVESTGITHFEPTFERCKSAELALKKRAHLQDNALRQFHQNNESGVSTEVIAMLAGMPLEMYRFKEASYIIRTNLFNAARATSNRLAGLNQLRASDISIYNTASSIVSEKQLLNLIDSKDFEQLASTLAQRSKASHLVRQVDLMSVVLIRHPSIDITDILRFIDAGVTPTLYSFLQVYSHPNRLELLEVLLSHSEGIALDTTWINEFYIDNLLIDALKHSDLEVALFWYNKGVPAQVATNQPNALDVFPKPKKDEYEVASQLLTQLLFDIQYPYEYAKYDVINEIISLLPQMELSDHALSPVKIGPITTAQIKHLHDSLAKHENIEGVISDQQYQSCLQLDAFNDYRLENAPLVHKDISARENIDIVASFLDIYIPFIGLFSGSEEALSNLKETFGVEIESTALDQAALMRALQEQQSKDDIIRIADHLAEIPSLVIHQATLDARFHLVDYFVNNRGLDINHKDVQGRGPLCYALNSPKPYRMFAYLAQHGAKPQAPDELMRRVIKFALLNKRHMKVLQWTARYVPIEQKHLTYFYQVASPEQPNYKAVLDFLESKAH